MTAASGPDLGSADVSPIRTVADGAEAARLGVGRHVAASFDHLDANHYLVPDEGDRLEVMGRFFGLLSEAAADGAGKIDYVEDEQGLAAVAVWFDRMSAPEEWDEYPKLLADAVGEFLPRFEELDEVFDANHPADAHWHLAFLAVRPDLWRHGLGSRLMDHTHQALDREGTAAYLEAVSPDTVKVYLAAGYREMDPFAIHIGDVPFYRMWRPPVA